MIVHRATGIVWRFFMGAVLDAITKERLEADDPRVEEILRWLKKDGTQVCPACGLDVDHPPPCTPSWWS